MEKMAKTMKQLVREERNTYNKKWRSKNKDKVKNYNDTYWKRRVEKKLKEARQSKDL